MPKSWRAGKQYEETAWEGLQQTIEDISQKGIRIATHGGALHPKALAERVATLVSSFHCSLDTRTAFPRPFLAYYPALIQRSGLNEDNLLNTPTTSTPYPTGHPDIPSQAQAPPSPSASAICRALAVAPDGPDAGPHTCARR